MFDFESGHPVYKTTELNNETENATTEALDLFTECDDQIPVISIS
jgi:hypothetical protein